MSATIEVGGRAPFRLSVLDQSPVAEGASGASALRNSIDLAQFTEGLGYHRYWVAEHHGSPSIAGTSPEVLIGPIASATSSIRVGSGGVMLPHYSPLKVAESFSMLSGLFPGRVDLGVGRAAGTDPRTTLALQRDRRQGAPDDFPHQLAELLAYLDGTIPEDHPFARLSSVLPGRPERPEPWLLGSSAQSGIWAAQLGLPYAFADFINSSGAPVAQRYRAEFEPRTAGDRPFVMVCVWALCADSDEEAAFLASSGQMLLTLLHRGQLIPVPRPEKAVEFLEELRQNPLPLMAHGQRRWIVGSPATVRRGLVDAAREYGADEVMVVTITHDHEARRRSYELIAGEMGVEAKVRDEDAQLTPHGGHG
jgi:luciferase family oxidoreductase group 1